MMDSMTILATDGIFKGSSSQRNSVNSLTQQYSINIHFSQSLQISNHNINWMKAEQETYVVLKHEQIRKSTASRL